MPSRLFKKTVAVSSAIFFSCIAAYAAEPAPFWGKTNADNINMRSDSTVNSRVICVLKKGSSVKVDQELYGWYKVKIPAGVPVYINADFLEFNAEKTAKVNRENVNIRLLPNDSSPIVGMADKDEVVEVAESGNKWLRIRPTEKTFGWINKKFVETTDAPVKEEIKETKEEKTQTPASAAEPEKILYFTGIIKPYGKFFKRFATHELLTEDRKTLLLKDEKNGLDAFNYKEAKVTGKIIGTSAQKYPIIEVTAIEKP